MKEKKETTGEREREERGSKGEEEGREGGREGRREGVVTKNTEGSDLHKAQFSISLSLDVHAASRQY